MGQKKKKMGYGVLVFLSEQKNLWTYSEIDLPYLKNSIKQVETKVNPVISSDTCPRLPRRG